MKNFMHVHILLRMALRAIYHHKIRSFLTLLGIVIGISGIITTVSVGKGAQKKARDQFLAYGSKGVRICRGNWMSSNNKPPKPLSLHDIDLILSQCQTIEYITPEASAYQIKVEYEGVTTSAEVLGTNENIINIQNETLQFGNFFSQEHIERKENVAVLSPTISELLFKSTNPENAIIRINQVPFIVIGTLAPPKIKRKWDGFGLPNIYIPFTTHQKYFGDKINTIPLSTYSEQQVPEVIRQIEKIFRASHHLEDGESNDFMIFDMQTFAAAAEEASKSIGLFALLAALVALLVGGIGVMNIMLVAVKERTKEIGIKSAIGATMNLIRVQFLIESTIICMLGGVLGVIFGITASFALEYFFYIPTIVELTPIIASFLVTVLIGLFFGFYPAEKAARLLPVEALTEL